MGFRGSGAYYNQLFTGPQDTGLDLVAKSSPSSDLGATDVSRTEFVTNVYSPSTPGGFTNNVWYINPGLATFPWLSQVAVNFTEYEFSQLWFHFEPAISMASTTGALGTIIMAVNYNAAQSPFTSAQQMQEYAGSIVAVPYRRIFCGVECDRRQLHTLAQYVRPGAVPNGEDPKTYDWGTFQIATDGLSAAAFPAGTLMGKLYVSYTVKLKVPRFYTGLGYSILCDSFVGTVGCATTLPFGTAPLKSGQNSIGGTITKSGSSGTVYTFPNSVAGYFALVLQSASTSSIFTITLGGQIFNYADMSATAGTSDSTIGATSSSSTVNVRHLVVNQATISGANTITITCSAAPTSAYMSIVEINPLNGPPYGASTNYVSA
jgi:hypothetical protein